MTWQRTDGTFLATDAAAHRADLMEYFAAHAIPAVLEFHPSVPYLVGVRLYVDDDGRVGTAGSDLAPGLEVDDLAEDIAERFGFDVLIGEIAVEEDEDEHTHDENCSCGVEDACGLGVRVLTITSANAAHLPILAREVGEPITAVLAGANAVVLTEPGEMIPGLEGFRGEAVPVVQLMLDEGDRSVVAHTEDYAPSTLTWGTDRVVIAGTPDPSEHLRARLELLGSNDDDAHAIASATAHADLDAVRAALAAPATEAFTLMVAALGLPPEFAEFLEGTRSAADVPGAFTVEPARGMVRSSISAVMDDPESRLGGMADEFAKVRPAAARSLGVAQGVLGVSLLAGAARARRPWRTVGITMGALLLADAFGELALYEWLRRRATR